MLQRHRPAAGDQRRLHAGNAPAWAVPLGCWFLRTEPVLALTGRRALPRRLLDEGFSFEHPGLPGALNHLYHHTP